MADRSRRWTFTTPSREFIVAFPDAEIGGSELRQGLALYPGELPIEEWLRDPASRLQLGQVFQQLDGENVQGESTPAQDALLAERIREAFRRGELVALTRRGFSGSWIGYQEPEPPLVAPQLPPPGPAAEPEPARQEAEKPVFKVRLHDGQSVPMTDVPYRLTLEGEQGFEEKSGSGWVEIELEPDQRSAQIYLEWGDPDSDGKFPYAREFHLEPEDSPERELAKAKLHNLGYPAEGDEEFEAAVCAFQKAHGIEEQGVEAGGVLPPQTREKLWAISEQDCDASHSSSQSSSTP